jgi:hypothetical protein
MDQQVALHVDRASELAASMDDHTMLEQEFWNAAYREHRIDALPHDLRQIGPLYELEPYLYACDFLFQSLGNPAGRRVLSIGGGIDGTALWLAGMGAEVSCLDLAADAMAATRALAERAGLASQVRCYVGRCEHMTFRNGFDIVLCRKALHHMRVREALVRIRASLRASGIFLAHEPVCLSEWLDRVHQRVPFHPDYPVIDGERQLSRDDLAVLEAVFPNVELHYFDLVTRPSVAYLIGRLGLKRVLRAVGRFDYHIIQSISWLKCLSSSVVIKAVNSGA